MNEKNEIDDDIKSDGFPITSLLYTYGSSDNVKEFMEKYYKQRELLDKELGKLEIHLISSREDLKAYCDEVSKIIKKENLGKDRLPISQWSASLDEVKNGEFSQFYPLNEMNKWIVNYDFRKGGINLPPECDYFIIVNPIREILSINRTRLENYIGDNTNGLTAHLLYVDTPFTGKRSITVIDRYNSKVKTK